MLPLVDDAGTIVPLGATLSLLATYQAAYVPRLSMSLSVQQVRDAFVTCGCFLPGAKMTEDRPQRLHRQLGRDIDIVTDKLVRAGDQLHVSITDGTRAFEARFPLADVPKVPAWIATRLHELRATSLTDTERATLARPDVPTVQALAQMDELACSWRGVPTSLHPSVMTGAALIPPRSAADELERWREIARAAPDSSYVAYQWLRGLAAQHDPGYGEAAEAARTRFAGHPHVQAGVAAAP